MKRRSSTTSANSRKRPVAPHEFGIARDTSPADAGHASRDVSVEALAERELQKGLAEVRQMFDAVLQRNADLGSDQREQMRRFFDQALEDAAASPGPAPEDVFDTATWKDMAGVLRQNGGIAEDDEDSVIRTLNDALAPLEKRETRLTIEFNRRMEVDGQQAAIEWLRGQSADSSSETRSDEVVDPVSSGNPPASRDDVVKSRSRRLRGPPR